MFLESAQERRAANIRAMLDGTLDVARKPLLGRYLSIAEGEATLRKAFSSPMPGAPAVSDALRRKLAARRTFVPWGGNTPFIPQVVPPPPPPLEPSLPPSKVPALLFLLTSFASLCSNAFMLFSCQPTHHLTTAFLVCLASLLLTARKYL